MPQPPPPAPQECARLPDEELSDDEGPAAKVDSRRLVSLLSQSGHFIESVGVETAWRRAKTVPQELHRYS
jgi:hypothetical protein